MNELPNNSYKFRSSLGEGEQKNEVQTRERPKPIIDAEDMIVSKQSALKRILNSVIMRDFDTAKHDILYDVIYPIAEDSLYNILQSSLAILFGRRYSPGGSRTNYSSISRSSNSYSSYYQKPANQEDEDNVYKFRTRLLADEVLEELKALRARYPFVKVADIYDLSNRTPPVTSFNWGWYDISQARVVRDNSDGKYILQMPKPRPLD